MDGVGGQAAEKARLRERFRGARDALGAAVRREASVAACHRAAALGALARIGDGATVALYAPLIARGELDVRPLGAWLRERGVRTALPRAGEGGTMEMHVWDGAPLVPGRWGLAEPDAHAEAVPPEALAVVVVPALAAGRDGSRLGWGGGFYDRYLARTPALRLVMTYSATLVDALPTEGHDERVDLVVTERESLVAEGRNSAPGEP